MGARREHRRLEGGRKAAVQGHRRNRRKKKVSEGGQAESAVAERRPKQARSIRDCRRKGYEFDYRKGTCGSKLKRLKLRKKEDARRKVHKINGCRGTAGRAENNRPKVKSNDYLFKDSGQKAGP
jgi:hypothetical protein